MMNFNEYKENKIFQLTSKYNAFLVSLNSSPFLEKLSKLDLNKLSSNKRLDFLINENIHLQDNVEFLQKKINEKLIGLDVNKNNAESSLTNNDDNQKKNKIDDVFNFQNASLHKEDLDFLKNEIISLNNVLIQVNGDINSKLDFSIKELTSLYENVMIEIQNLSNKEFNVSTPTLPINDISDRILQTINFEIKNELILLKDNFDKKLDDLKNTFESKLFIKKEFYKSDKSDFDTKENNHNYVNDFNENDNLKDVFSEDNNLASTTLHSYYNDEINLNKEDLDQIFGENENISTKKTTSLPTINPASINALEKNISDVNLKLNKMLVETEKQKSNISIEKKYINATIDIESKWNNIVANMDQNIELMTEENKFLKSKFNDLQKKYEDLKKDYIDKNNNANSVEKILSLTNHKFDELSKILDQQDIMMKNLQAENKLFFEKCNFKKINDERIVDNIYEAINTDKSIDLVSSNLKNLENKLMNIQYELSRIENDDFDSLIEEYRDKVI